MSLAIRQSLGKEKTGLKEAISYQSGFVARPGFEPRQSDPETDVLPLYYRAETGAKIEIKS
jgi:hypothetical protein